jgi:dTDP-4-dehydrorhamnose reductase
MRTSKILVLSTSGMLGHTLFLRLSERNDLDVFSTVRDQSLLPRWFAPERLKKIRSNVHADRFETVKRTLDEIKPDVVINCIGIIKQLPISKDPITSITINALFPHRLAQACQTVGARMIHISTDCVFSGRKGNYKETDIPDANDLYGRTKLLGEVEYSHCVTLRTSIIGHELKGKYGLIEWFLSQEGKVRGFTRAIYSGLPTVEMAKIIAEYVLPYGDLHGLYHVSSEPISKYDMLKIVAEKYGKKIEIEPASDIVIDRSLDSKRFRDATGYKPPTWPDLINAMYRDFKDSSK